MPPIISDGNLVDVGLKVGQEVWGNQSKLVDSEFLSGDSAAYYFDYAQGIFFIFTAEKKGEPSFPLHNGQFDLDEDVFWKATESLRKFILNLS